MPDPIVAHDNIDDNDDGPMTREWDRVLDGLMALFFALMLVRLGMFLG